MPHNLTGKTALITGAGRRIGRTVALTLANEGANVIIHYRSSASEAEEVVEQAKALGVDAWSIQADLTNNDELETLIEHAYQLAGPINILINNASSFHETDFFKLTFEELIADLQLNAWAPFLLARKFAEKMDGGHIINFLDTRIVGYDWPHFAYHASKSLLALFTNEMALQYAPNFAVNAVAPGLILPPAGRDPEYIAEMKSRLPMKRQGSPQDVADAILYLVTSTFVTGQVIYIDGGRHIREAPGGENPMLRKK